MYIMKCNSFLCLKNMYYKEKVIKVYVFYTEIKPKKLNNYAHYI